MDSTNNRVGIGTTTPTGLLHVASDATTSLIVLSSGNVGIGTITPAADLVVARTASSTLQIGSGSLSSCLVMDDSDGSGVTYVTVADGVFTATSTKSAACR